MRSNILILWLCILSLNSLAQDIGMDIRMGNEAARQVELQMGIYQAPVTGEYISDIGNRLTGRVHQPFRFSFKLIDSPIPNAFALPGGHVYITRGLLALTNSEDELGGVIGHEISHVLERHSVKQLEKAMFPALLMIPGALIGKVSSGMGALINAPIAATSKIFLASYSRKQEKEADRVGAKLAAISGYTPMSLGRILENLSSAVEYSSGEKEKRSYFDDHPLTDDRVKAIEKISHDQPVAMIAPLAPTKEAFYSKLEGLCYGENPAAGIFRDGLFLHPDLKIALTFPSGWNTLNFPSLAGAYNKEERSMVFLSARDTLTDPGALAGAAEKMILDKYNITPEESKNIELPGYRGHYLKFRDQGNENINIVSLLFLTNGQFTFQISGLGTNEDENELVASVLSFRGLQPDELIGITVQRLRTVKAKNGETIEDFNARTGNKWSVELTSIANDLDQQERLAEGQLLKIVLEEPYK
jgi:predicted Zn-dependent protease